LAEPRKIKFQPMMTPADKLGDIPITEGNFIVLETGQILVDTETDRITVSGEKGDTGTQGMPGNDGTDGVNGAAFVPTVSAAGVISWENDGGLPNPLSVNIKGERGEDGAQGLQGIPGTPGEKGADGAQGENGQDGAAGKSAFEAAQSGGFAGTESQFNTALANVDSKINSDIIRTNTVVTRTEYQLLKTAGTLDPNTAYDIVYN